MAFLVLRASYRVPTTSLPFHFYVFSLPFLVVISFSLVFSFNLIRFAIPHYTVQLSEICQARRFPLGVSGRAPPPSSNC